MSLIEHIRQLTLKAIECGNCGYIQEIETCSEENLVHQGWREYNDYYKSYAICPYCAGNAPNPLCAGNNKSEQLQTLLLLNTLKTFFNLVIDLHPALKEPSHNIDGCLICEQLVAANNILIIHGTNN